MFLPMTAIEKLRCWSDSVRGLHAHVRLYRAMRKFADGQPPSEAFTRQLRDQEGMIGHCLLHVLLVHPIGSGRFV